MNIRKTGLMGAVALTCIAVAFFKPRAVRSDTLTILTPGGWFRIPGANESLSVNGFRAAGGNLYFLLATGPIQMPARSSVIETNTKGGLLHRVEIQDARAEAFAVDESGRIMARIQEGDFAHGQRTQSLMIWDSYGVLQRRIDNARGGGRLAFHAGEPMSIDQAGLSPLDDSSNVQTIPLSDLGPAEAVSPLAVSETETALISQLTGIMAVVSGDAIIRRVQLAAPEIQGVKRDTVHGQSVFFALSSDEQGRIFGMISPFKRDSGPVILEFNDAGQLLNRYRAAPAVLPQFQNAKNLHAVSSPLSIAVAGGKLFLQSGRGSDTTIIWYTLPS